MWNWMKTFLAGSNHPNLTKHGPLSTIIGPSDHAAKAAAREFEPGALKIPPSCNEFELPLCVSGASFIGWRLLRRWGCDWP